MPNYRIRGINVDFPFEAYECQLVYMEKVIQSLQQRTNALLESPTGTGKTLCLLCATLAWRKSLGGFSTGRSVKKGRDAEGKHSEDSLSQSESPKLPTIIYTSRTHSQIRQVIQELKRTNYRPKMGVLGSREQLCIHEEVSLLRGKAQTNACHSLCKKRTKRYCAHYSRVQEFMKNTPGLGDEPIDIEDLVNIGKSSGPCPYYMSRDLHKVVDILFAPYNYLIEPTYRKSLSIEWENSVLIFDEAHNLESICADAASFDLPSGLLTACIAEAKSCVDLSIARRDKSNDKSCYPDNFAILRALLLKLEKRIAEVPIESKDIGFTKPGPYIYELLADLNITKKTSDMLIGIIEEAVLLLEEDANGTDSGVPQKTKGVCRLETIGDILNIIFRDGGDSHATYYRVHVQELEGRASEVFKGKASRIFSWWCFNPGLAMEEFRKLHVGSIILTSGTLSPMDSFAEELKLEFPIRLENPHVISANQIWAGILPVGPSGYSFNSSYRSRDSPEYKLELGNAIGKCCDSIEPYPGGIYCSPLHQSPMGCILQERNITGGIDLVEIIVNFARIVPDGLLVFFPSYVLLDLCIGFWKNKSASSANSSTIWERICKHKKPVVEPRQSSLFPLSIDDYMAKLKDNSTSGAVFFAVCRGKVSEGLDFADHAGRAVIITGMPFATRTDPKVRLKREFLDRQAQSQRIGSKVLTGEEWYSQQASRAVNQAVGRVIRHRYDYGAIIFCDERFTSSNRQSQISRWIQPHIKCYSKFGDVVFTLTRFFRDAAISGPAKQDLTQIEDQGDTKRKDSVVPLGKLHLEKFLSPLPAATETCSAGSLSSLAEVKRLNISGHLAEILPANHSNLTFDKFNQSFPSRCSSDPICNEKKVCFSRKKNMQISKHELVDLTRNELFGEETSKGVISSCSRKKPKLENPCCNLTQLSEKSCEDLVKKLPLNNFFSDSPKPARLEILESGSNQNAQDGLGVLRNDEMTKQKRTTEFLSQKSKDDPSSPAPCGDEEKRGSTFLIQVQEKLTDAEYKEFVGFMKGLKSKAMQIGHVLQSITRLFSAPDRFPLLQRFKDFIPTKHHSLYDQYLKRNSNAIDL